MVATPKLIALYSPTMQSGKSTVAEHLVLKHGFKRVTFADSLKQMARVFLEPYADSEDDLDRMMSGDLKETVIPALGRSPRYVMQTLGTEWGRDCIGADTWVNIAMAKVKSRMAQGHSVVIDDMRFANELRAVHTVGQSWIIIRPDAPVMGTKHPSEGQLDYLFHDKVLLNIGTRKDLRASVDGLMGA